METNALLFATLTMSEARDALEAMFAEAMDYCKPETVRGAYAAFKRPTHHADAIANLADRLLGIEKGA
jgi:hypothetical protein